jgi:hypothetical protein
MSQAVPGTWHPDHAAHRLRSRSSSATHAATTTADLISSDGPLRSPELPLEALRSPEARGLGDDQVDLATPHTVELGTAAAPRRATTHNDQLRPHRGLGVVRGDFCAGGRFLVVQWGGSALAFAAVIAQSVLVVYRAPSRSRRLGRASGLRQPDPRCRARLCSAGFRCDFVSCAPPRRMPTAISTEPRLIPTISRSPRRSTPVAEPTTRDQFRAAPIHPQAAPGGDAVGEAPAGAAAKGLSRQPGTGITIRAEGRKANTPVR